MGKYKANTVTELVELMEQDYDYNILRDFKEKYISVNTNNCTKQIVEFIVRLIKNEEVENMGNEPIKEKQNI